MRRALAGIAVVLAVGLAVAFIVARLLSARDDLGAIPTVERPWALAPGVALYAGALVGYAVLWREIIGRLDGVRSPVIDSVAAFCASWLGRYVPGSLPYVGGTVALGRRLGHSKTALASALVYENVLLIAVGAATSAVVLPLALVDDAEPLVYVSAALGGLAALGALSPPVVHRAVRLAARVARREALASAAVLPSRGVLAGALIATVALACNGAGFALVLGSFTELSARELLASAAAFNLAGAAGIAVVPVPSGLGVREAVLIAVVQAYAPVEAAVAAAVVARLGGLLVDLAFGLGGAGLLALRWSRLVPVAPTTSERSELYAGAPVRERAA